MRRNYAKEPTYQIVESMGKRIKFIDANLINYVELKEVEEILIKEEIELDHNFFIYPGDKVKRFGKQNKRIRSLHYDEPSEYLGYIIIDNRKILIIKTNADSHCEAITFIGYDYLVFCCGTHIIDFRALKESEIIRGKR